ncbi:MAG TPA: polyphosphate kinase 2 family protein, partial [Candidatus Udaeobacter sp.]|nr:polyphosphate kinase 2 family protein [Candidatus Udaeobacter sp.]
MKEIIDRAKALARPYRITDGKDFKLAKIDPEEIGEFKDDDKSEAKEALAEVTSAMADLQGKLYAQNQWAVLLIFQ